MENSFIINTLKDLFPNAKCELNYSNDWQLLIAILLSAQCTDKKVNQITPILFSKYPSLKSLKEANYNDLEEIIYPLGLSKTKAANIIKLSTILHDKYNDLVPNKKDDLISLPGIGNKTANVMLIEYFNIPAFPVDTHVSRVTKRLEICKENSTTSQIESIVMKRFPKEEWASLHIRLVLFGRYICKAIKPICNSCPFKEKCNYNK